MAAGSTYTPIATNTVSGSTTNSLTFSSISNAYTDLVLIVSAKMATTAADLGIRLNSDSGSNYSLTYLTGSGTSISSPKGANLDKITVEYNASIRTGEYCVYVINIQNYSNTATNKVVLSRANSTTGTDASIALWRNTSAINSIYMYSDGGPYFATGSTFTLYGITAA